MPGGPVEECVVLSFGARSAGQLRDMLEAAEAEPGQAAGEAPAESPVRAALVAAGTDELHKRLHELRSLLDVPEPPTLAGRRGAFVGSGLQPARIGFLFPGQGAPVRAAAGAVGELFPQAARVHDAADLPREDIPDELVQLAVVTSSVAALRAVDALGIEADVALGHSLGEITALHWAGAIDEAALLRTVRARGHAMVLHAGAGGAMASVIADEDTVAQVVEGIDVTVACMNSPRQHAISGAAGMVEEALARAREMKVRAILLRVTGAFHSPLMSDAVPVFTQQLGRESFGPLERAVVSTVTGTRLAPDADLHDLLARQIMEPVRFADAVREAAPLVDLFVEVGPGRALAGLVAETADVPIVSVRMGESSPRGILEVAAAAFAAGVPGAVQSALEARAEAQLAAPGASP